MENQENQEKGLPAGSFKSQSELVYYFHPDGFSVHLDPQAFFGYSTFFVPSTSDYSGSIFRPPAV